MGFTKEIFFSNKHISITEWEMFVCKISKLCGRFKRWKLYVKIDKNTIHYYLYTLKNLSPTINHLNSFLLKECSQIFLSNIVFSTPLILGEKNIFDFMEADEVLNYGKLQFLALDFFVLSKLKPNIKIYGYFEKNGYLKKRRLILGNVFSLLSLDFEHNKRYFYKSVPKYLDINKFIPILKKEKEYALFQVDTFPYFADNYYLNQTSFQFDKHSLILGASGSGKSKFISSFIYNIYRNEAMKKNYKIVVIDPHAALEKDIGGIGNVIDFLSIQNSIDLFINQNKDIISSSELILELLKSLMADQYNSKLERVLRHSIYLLLELETFNFSNLRCLLTDLVFRNKCLERSKNSPRSVIDFFANDFTELKTKSYGEAISPIIALLDEMEMVPVFRGQDYLNSLENILKNNFLTIFSLDRIKIGEKVTKTISGLIMQQLFRLIENYTFQEHIIFIIDEIAVIENPILIRFLSEARKFHLSLMLAGQYFNQVTIELKDAIFANIVNYYIFRVSKLDASILSDNFNMKLLPSDSQDAKVQLITELKNRECIIRVEQNNVLLPAIKGVTLDFESIPRIHKKVDWKTSEEKDKFIEELEFDIHSSTNLKEIFKTNSTSRKVLK